MTRKEKVTFINNEILTTNEVAEILQLSRQQVLNLVTDGKLSVVKKTSKGNLFLREDILNYLKEKRLGKKDLVGRRFGKLVVVKVTKERKRGHVLWECRCDCGQIAFVSGSDLKSGNNRSCGCMKRKKISV